MRVRAPTRSFHAVIVLCDLEEIVTLVIISNNNNDNNSNKPSSYKVVTDIILYLLGFLIAFC
jgi:hypothetical protein